jgi:hypothetical protein
MFQHYLKLQNKISSYKDMIEQFNFQISNLEYDNFSSYATNDKIKENTKKINDYKKTIKMYEDLIQKLENQLKNEFTEYVV